MKPNNEFTSEGHKFFYPVNHEIEYHESLDIDALPQVKAIGGRDHFTVFIKPNGELRGYPLGSYDYNIPGGSLIKSITAFNPGNQSDVISLPPYLDSKGVEELDQNNPRYDVEDSDLLIVQLDYSELLPYIPIEEQMKKGIMLVPAGKPLPDAESLGAKVRNPDNITFRLHGVITSSDRLINWHGPRSMTTYLVDLSVAFGLAQNPLEIALLEDSLGLERSLTGTLSGNEAATTYLEYYDKKHGTTFMPTKDPQTVLIEDKQQRNLYRCLTSQADVYMNRKRD